MSVRLDVPAYPTVYVCLSVLSVCLPVSLSSCSWKCLLNIRRACTCCHCWSPDCTWCVCVSPTSLGCLMYLKNLPIAGKEYPWGSKFESSRMNIWQGKFPDENTKEDGYLGAAPVDAYDPQNKFGIMHAANLFCCCEDSRLCSSRSVWHGGECMGVGFNWVSWTRQPACFWEEICTKRRILCWLTRWFIQPFSKNHYKARTHCGMLVKLQIEVVSEFCCSGHLITISDSFFEKLFRLLDWIGYKN